MGFLLLLVLGGLIVVVVAPAAPGMPSTMRGGGGGGCRCGISRIIAGAASATFRLVLSLWGIVVIVYRHIQVHISTHQGREV